MATQDLTTPPTPQHLTLLFKHHKSTTVLSLLPTTPLTTAKSTLLSVLKSRSVKTLPGTSTPLPTQPTDLEFGILADRRDPTKGFVYAEDRSTLTQTAVSAKKKANAKKDGPIETFGDLDLKDGAWVAYRVRRRGVDLEEGAEDMDVEVGGNVSLEWDVVLPSYDDEEEQEQGQEGGDGDDDMDEEMHIPIPKPRNAVAR